jgi:hypothetical protein
MSFNFFKTVRPNKSDIVLKLERIGKSMQLLQAIEAERKDIFSNTGSSANGEVMVRRVGAYDNKKGR